MGLSIIVMESNDDKHVSSITVDDLIGWRI